MEELESKLRAGADRETLAAYVAKAERTRAVAFLSALYRETGSREVHEALRRVATWPELKAAGDPPESPGTRRMEARPYARLLWGSIVWPFTSVASIVVILLGGWAFGTAAFVLQFVGAGCLCGSLGALALLSYLVAYLFEALSESAEGSVRPPGWNQVRRPGDAFGALMRWCGAATVSFAPATLLAAVATGCWRLAGPVVGLPLAVLTAGVWLAGLAYHPMALMAAALDERIESPFRLVQGLRNIRRLGRDYWRCTSFVIVSSLFTAGLSQILPLFRPDLLVQSLALGSWPLFLAYFMQMRAIGLLAYARSDDLRLGPGS